MKKKKIIPARPENRFFSETSQKKGRITITFRNLQKTIPITTGTKQAIAKTVLKTFSFNRYKNKAEICLCFVDDRIIKELNKRYLGKSYATDVICFDLSQNLKKIAADIAISADTVTRNAKVFSNLTIKELHLCVIHGIMHLLGYNDDAKTRRSLMEKKSLEIMESLKI